MLVITRGYYPSGPSFCLPQWINGWCLLPELGTQVVPRAVRTRSPCTAPAPSLPPVETYRFLRNPEVGFGDWKLKTSKKPQGNNLVLVKIGLGQFGIPSIIVTCCEWAKQAPLLINHPMGKGHLCLRDAPHQIRNLGFLDSLSNKVKECDLKE